MRFVTEVYGSISVKISKKTVMAQRCWGPKLIHGVLNSPENTLNNFVHLNKLK